MKTDRVLILLWALMLPITSSVLANTPAGNSKHGQNLYQQYCFRCHGGRLDGNGPDAGSLRVRPCNLRTYVMLDRGSSELENAIRDSRRHTPRHTWGIVLTDQEIYDLVAYIRTEIPQIEGKP